MCHLAVRNQTSDWFVSQFSSPFITSVWIASQPDNGGEKWEPCLVSHAFKFKKKGIAVKGFMVLDDIPRTISCEPITNHSNHFLIIFDDSTLPSSLPVLNIYNTLLIGRLILTWFPTAPQVIVNPLRYQTLFKPRFYSIGPQ